MMHQCFFVGTQATIGFFLCIYITSCVKRIAHRKTVEHSTEEYNNIPHFSQVQYSLAK